MTAVRMANDLYLDSEASLRLVDTVLADLREASGTGDVEGPTALASLPGLLLRAYAEINNALQALRQSRGALEQSTVERIHLTSQKLQEVSSATETAATDMLDGLDRAINMIGDMDEAADAGDAPRGLELRTTLRDELFGLMGHLQFQDITTQQLNHASSILADMETRLLQLSRIFDPSLFGLEIPRLEVATSGAAFDPAATTHDAEQRQALVDEIFG